MAVTEGNHAGEFLLSEGNGTISREQVTILSGENLVAGEVLGKVTASGKYVAYDDTAVDRSEVAAGILFNDVDATSGDQLGTAIVLLAEVSSARLTGIDANGINDLASKFIVVR